MLYFHNNIYIESTIYFSLCRCKNKQPLQLAAGSNSGAMTRRRQGAERGRGKCAAQWRVVIVVAPIATPLFVVVVAAAAAAAWAFLGVSGGFRSCIEWQLFASSLAVVYIKGV